MALDVRKLVHEVVSVRLCLIVLKWCLCQSSWVLLEMWRKVFKSAIRKESSSSEKFSKSESSCPSDAYCSTTFCCWVGGMHGVCSRLMIWPRISTCCYWRASPGEGQSMLDVLWLTIRLVSMGWLIVTRSTILGKASSSAASSQIGFSKRVKAYWWVEGFSGSRSHWKPWLRDL